MSSGEHDGTSSQLNKFEKLSWRPLNSDSGSKKRTRWLLARRIFSPSCPNLRIPNRFLREGHCVPPARSGHRCVADSTNLYVFGGFNPDFEEAGGSENEDYPLFRELWRFHFATATWQQIHTEGYMPTELASMSAVLHGNNLLVFGGTGIPFGENNGNDVHVCNVQYKGWNLLNCRGKKPNKIYGQAMVIINGYLYVFGGTTGYLYSTDLHRLDLTTREWTHLKPNNAPSDLPEERYRQSREVKRCSRQGEETLRLEVFICGGYNGELILSDLWKINLQTFQWTKLPAAMPEPAYFHCAAVTPAGCMYVHGGVVNTSGNRRTGSLYKVWLVVPSLLELTWEKLLKTFPHLDQLSTLQLLSMGLTHALIQRLK
ncbi:Kelch domain-containing protein 10 [Liparis tanakae]|uniref:Kelch domain-containing protein 10 n=1 Tax=Liparis tanakae TaxID=230148 RepID=A0A4Z2HYP8_9TELE|nr:Kelch domain-containing protein 10 [Liparis tanakae]